MTKILFDLKETSPNGDVPIDAQINCYPVARRKDGTVLVTRRGFTERTGFKPVVIDLHHTGLDGAWLITISSHNNDIVHGFYAVPKPVMVDGKETPNPFIDLIEVDPGTLEPTENPDPIWWAMARSTVTDGSVDGSGDLILTHYDGKKTNAGRVKGDRGERGLQGLPGQDGTNGINGLNGINGRDGKDGVDGLDDAGISNLIQTPTSETATALSAAIDDKLDGLDFGSSSATYLDSYAWMGEGNAFVDAQRITATTTTAAVSAGASILPLADVTGITAGVILVAHGATANQQLVRVASVAGSDVTIVGTLTTALASGATVAPAWINSSHLTNAGYDAMAYWLARNLNLPDLSGKKVTLLGNSWFDGKSMWAAQIMAAFPTATVVNAGIAGNTSTALLARFDASVPADSDVVIIDEPGVNDGITPTIEMIHSLSNLSQLLAKIENIGATAVVTGPVPLSTHPAKTKALGQRVPAALRNDMATALSPTTNATSVGTGPGVHREFPTGGNNTAYGSLTQRALTTGTNNTGYGSKTQQLVSTGKFNTAIGSEAQAALTTGGSNAAVGGWTQKALTTGIGNTSMGHQSTQHLTVGMYNTHIGTLAGDGTTTASNQVFIGANTGLKDTAVQSTGVVAIGQAAKAGGNDSVSIGRGASADGLRAVALGAGAVASAADEFVIGVATHRYKMPGLPTANPGAGTGVLWNDAGVVKVA